MSDGKKYYCYCDSNCKYETMTKEQILAAIAQAVEKGSLGDCDTGFITKVKENNGGRYVTFWVGTQAQYNEIENKVENCLYIIEDETTASDIEKLCASAINMATEAKVDASAALAKVGSVNFTNSVDMDWSEDKNPNMGMCEFLIMRIEYSPSAEIVHFLVDFEFEGSLAKGEQVDCYLQGIDKRMLPKTVDAFPVCCNDARFSAYICRSDDSACLLRITANEAIDNTPHSYAMFSGWYFAGEAEGE